MAKIKKDKLEFIITWFDVEKKFRVLALENGVKMAAPRYEALDDALAYCSNIVAKRIGEIKNDSVSIIINNI